MILIIIHAKPLQKLENSHCCTPLPPFLWPSLFLQAWTFQLDHLKALIDSKILYFQHFCTHLITLQTRSEKYSDVFRSGSPPRDTCQIVVH